MARPTLQEWLSEQEFALALSSGFFGFYAHLGLSAALYDKGIKPAFLCGSSAGAIVSAALASEVSIDTVQKTLFSLRRQDFWDPGLGFGLLRGRLFESQLTQLLPHRKIEDCQTPLSISVFDLMKMRAIGLQKGDMAKAVRASCSVPFLFQPVVMQRKVYLDGGLKDKAGLADVQWSGRLLYHHLLEGNRLYKKNDKTFPKFANQHDACSIVCERLPYVNPFALEKGQQAFHHAFKSMTNLLTRPVDGLFVS